MSNARRDGRENKDSWSHKPTESGVRLRMPPQNQEAEEGVIGSILQDQSALDVVAPLIRQEDFYDDRLGLTYKNILILSANGKPIDGVTLGDQMVLTGDLDRISIGYDGLLFLADIQNAVPHAANAEYYAQIVRQKAITRRLIEDSTVTLTEAYSERHTAEELIEAAEKRIFAVAEFGTEDRTAHVSIGALQALERMGSRKRAISGVAIGLTQVDSATDGFQPSQLTVIAARPGHGKTALALNLLERYASTKGEDGTPNAALFFSLEMNQTELVTRLIVTKSQVYSHKLLDPNAFMSARDTAAVSAAYDDIRRMPIYINDTPMMTATEIAAVSRRYVRKHHVGLVIVDYLQLISPEEDRDSRQEQVAKMSRRLKILAREINRPVVVLSQLSRKSEERKDKRPILSDLRESGAIEQDADIVILLHVPSMYDPNDKPNTADVILVKNRNGPPRTATVTWVPSLYLFTDLDTVHSSDIPQEEQTPSF